MTQKDTIETNIDEDDEDMFSDYKEAFPNSYSFSKNVSLNENDPNEYVTHLAANKNVSVIAAGLSDSTIVAYDANTLTKKNSLKAHDGHLSELVFSPKHEQLMYTCSPQECIKLWDMRDYKKPARSFVDNSVQANKAVTVQNGNSDVPKKPLLCMDVNKDDEFLAGGTEQVVKDAFILFWDVGSGKMLGGYWDSYGDDVTTVAFHSEDADKLATGGTDGLINVFDISQSSEDDALVTSVNTESSIQKICWYKVS